MSAHTPGPLGIIADGDEPNAPKQIGVLEGGVCHQLVAEVFGRTLEELDANAHLMALSPELLKALETLVNALHDADSEEFDTEVVGKELREAWHVLMRAKGLKV